jgi:hypothetical protein
MPPVTKLEALSMFTGSTVVLAFLNVSKPITPMTIARANNIRETIIVLSPNTSEYGSASGV